MKLKHVALVSSSEENSDRFFQGVLNLEKQNVKNLPADLSELLFDRKEDFKLIIYGAQGLQFEIFISKQSDYAASPLSHTCLEVEDRDAFLEKCLAAKLEVRRVPKNGSTVALIKDYDGNLYEIK